MRVLFLQRDTMVKIATMLLSAVLKEDGHECELLIDEAERDLVSKAVGMRPDLVAFSCTTGGQGWVLETCARLKQQLDVPVLVGGPHATFFPELVREPQVDIVCRGEGEDPIREIVRALVEDRPEALATIPNVWVERDGEIVSSDVRPLWADLDTLPFPDWDLYRRRYAFLVPYYEGNFPVITSRGCPHMCSYCFNRSYKRLYEGKGRYVRRETPTSAVARLARMRDEFRVRRFNFVDDFFVGRTAWLEEFADLYRTQIGLPYICNVRADNVSEKTARILSEAGCYCMRMGIESGADRVRREILDKRISEEDIRNAAALAHTHRMKLVTYNIYGSPGETLEEALCTYELNRDLHVDFAQCSILQPYPGTRIRERAEEMGLISTYVGDSVSDVGESYFIESPMRLERKREITNLQKLTSLCVRLRVPTSVMRRVIRVPENGLFYLAFRLGYALFRFRLDVRETLPFLRFALHSRMYMARRSSGRTRSAS